MGYTRKMMKEDIEYACKNERAVVLGTLKRLLIAHEEKNLICCPESCFCWDIRTYLTNEEIKIIRED